MRARQAPGTQLATALLLTAAVAGAQPDGELLAFESFEDTVWASRGWYDGPRLQTAAAADAPHGERVNVWHWRRAGDVNTAGGGARMHLPPVEDVTLSFAIRFSDNWRWTGRPFHPHMFNFLTDEDDDFVGPAYTHLTTYAEIVNGVPRLSLQDGRNVDTARVAEDLTQLTEARAVAGCNGDTDGHGKGDCYRQGEAYFNGKFYEAAHSYFDDRPGRRYKGDWHRVAARFRLNSIVDGKAQRDGVLQMWVDGEPVIDVRDAVLRTGQHPDMRFDQFMMAPYYGPGVPHEQWAWVDDVRIVATQGEATTVRPADTSWATVKEVAE